MTPGLPAPEDAHPHTRVSHSVCALFLNTWASRARRARGPRTLSPAGRCLRQPERQGKLATQPLWKHPERRQEEGPGRRGTVPGTHTHRSNCHLSQGGSLFQLKSSSLRLFPPKIAQTSGGIRVFTQKSHQPGPCPPAPHLRRQKGLPDSCAGADGPRGVAEHTGALGAGHSADAALPAVPSPRPSAHAASQGLPGGQRWHVPETAQRLTALRGGGVRGRAACGVHPRPGAQMGTSEL